MGNCLTPADDEFRRFFERCEIPNDEFRHRDHLRLAWIYLRESDVSTAAARVGQSIRRYAEHHGVARKYHETLSPAWVRIVALAIAETPDAAGFDDLVAAQSAPPRQETAAETLFAAPFVGRRGARAVGRT